jgi:4-amino-4-deoxy-L-arabinose transferase-like glycosyltransferase
VSTEGVAAAEPPRPAAAPPVPPAPPAPEVPGPGVDDSAGVVAAPARLARPAWLGLAGLAAVLVALETAVSARYGYHRDELYFLAASDHLAWGYVDQPPLTVALAGLAKAVFGDSLVGLRLLPAVAVGVAVVLTGLTARELAGSDQAVSRAAQVLAAACVAASGVTVALGHLHATATFDLAFWAALLLALVRLLRTDDARLWPVVGVLAGVGMLNKTTVLQLAGVCLLGLLADRRGRALLATPHFAAAVLIAGAIASPYLAWQAGHGWPQLEIFADLRAENGGLGAGLAFIPLQVPMTNPFLTPVWVLGLLWLLRSPDGRRWRPVAVGYLLLVAFYVAVGGKPYYAFGFYPALFAAGAVRLAARAAARAAGRDRSLRLRRALPAVALAAVPLLPLLLPVLPASSLSWTSAVNDDAAETFGWPAYVRQIEQVRAGLPAAERAEAAVVTGNYGEAGALVRFAAPEVAARTFSGHNSYWFFGRPAVDGAIVVAVGFPRSWLAGRFDSVTPARRLDNGAGIDNEEQGRTVWVCRGMHGSWASAWIDWRHYDG